MPNLVSVKVKELLGQFNHSFDFPADDEFRILHGPNGIGKTKLLELIEATLGGNPFKIASIPFREATFWFDDESRLRIFSADGNPGSGQLESEDDEPSPSDGLTFELTLSSGEVVIEPGPKISPSQLRRIRTVMEHELPLNRVAPDMWNDPASNRNLSTIEAINLYSSVLESRSGLVLDLWAADNPVRQFLGELSVHFVETQRLLTDDRRVRHNRFGDRYAASRSTVLELADDLVVRLKDALAHNARTSQQLDRDFPRRIILEEDSPRDVSAEEIEQKYEQQTRLRQALAESALLDMPGHLPLPSRKLEGWERRFLWTYLADTEKKLETFIPILEKIQLLTDIVNSRFLYKKLKIDANAGLRFVTSTGAEISPGVLSSGEQHELVLVYNLLFQAQENSLVLIDEPEISLHVAWQRAFLDDIIRIAKLSSLRFIIATHSPQVINKWWSRTEALHAGYEEDGIAEK